MRKMLILAVLTAGMLVSVADAKPRITGGNQPPLEKPRMTGGNNPPVPSPAIQLHNVECKALNRFLNVRC